MSRALPGKPSSAGLWMLRRETLKSIEKHAGMDAAYAAQKRVAMHVAYGAEKIAGIHAAHRAEKGAAPDIAGVPFCMTTLTRVSR